MTRRRALLTVVLAAVIALCSVLVISRGTSVSGVTLSAETLGLGKCAAQVAPGVKLSEGDRCALDLVAKRCGELDACFADCWASGTGRNVGGGCGHICNR